MNNIEKRLKELEKNSHPPVNWKELIYANIERIEYLESENEKLIDIIMSITNEKKKLKNRVEVMEKILHAHIPIIQQKGDTNG